MSSGGGVSETTEVGLLKYSNRVADRDYYRHAEDARYKGGLADGLTALRAAQKAGLPEPTFNGQEQSGTSIFDPVLCELCYSWFSAPGHAVLDPFAGGSVRGIVASILDRHYTGIELRPEQVEANRQQVGICQGHPAPEWRCGDSGAILPAMSESFDFLFSCPPYGSLEVYSDLPEDLSALGWPAFQKAYAEIIRLSVARLRDNRFACFVVGNFRNKKGFYCDLVGTTVAAFEAAGAGYYNEAVLVTAVGSLPVRINQQWKSGRKLGKTHQNVLVFCKGDPRKAAAEIGGIDA